MWNQNTTVGSSGRRNLNTLLEESCDALLPDNNLGKENMPPNNQDLDISLYGNFSAEGSSFQQPYLRKPFGEHDPNSVDSGYGSSCLGEHIHNSQLQKGESMVKNLSNSFMSVNSLEDDFFEFSDLAQSLDKTRELPSDFNSLINEPFTSPALPKQLEIAPGHDFPIRSIQRSDLMNIDTPNSSKTRIYLRKEINQSRPHKRLKLHDDTNTPQKYIKVVEEALVPVNTNKNVIATEESIKCALQKSCVEPDLIGDLSRPYTLPLISGRNQDLKSISSTTLALLLKGKYKDVIKSFKIIDCRYPYEYEGGHISEAINIFSKDQLLETLWNADLVSTDVSEQSSEILIFHCEFSRNRGPNLYRYLRNHDRNYNKNVYPALYYPEIYLLEGGYKKFYETHEDLCVPRAYIPMVHPEHRDKQAYFKEKSKSLNIDRTTLSSQGALKRLSFAENLK